MDRHDEFIALLGLRDGDFLDVVKEFLLC